MFHQIYGHYSQNPKIICMENLIWKVYERDRWDKYNNWWLLEKLSVWEKEPSGNAWIKSEPLVYIFSSIKYFTH